jgi:hypothetical protein
MRQINDPIQPRAEQILLPGLLSLPRPHRSPSLDHLEGKESQPPIRRNRKNNFARKPQRSRPIPAKTITWKDSITHLVQRLRNNSRRLGRMAVDPRTHAALSAMPIIHFCRALVSTPSSPTIATEMLLSFGILRGSIWSRPSTSIRIE